MKLYFIRHGQKQKGDFFSEHIGQQNPPLTEHGVAQAEAMSRCFEDKPVERVLASEYVRAQQTAAPVAKLKSLQVEVDARLNEIHAGITEPMSDEELQNTYPQFWDDFFGHQRDVRFPGGETGEEVRERQLSLLDDCLKIGKDAVLVCHEGYIRLIMCTVLGLPVYHRYKFRMDYCGITVLERSEGEWHIERFNQA